jgi:hypothetical protein
MSNKNETAVRWLVKEISRDRVGRAIITTFLKEIEQAKELEKQQIIDAFWNGDNIDCISEQNIKEFAEKYYSETYNNI